MLKELCLEITNRCPLSCLHCSSNSTFGSEDELDIELIKKTISDFKKLGGRILEISGDGKTGKMRVILAGRGK